MQPQNPNPFSLYNHRPIANYSSHLPQNLQTPIPSPNTGLNLSGLDPYTSLSSNPLAQQTDGVPKANYQTFLESLAAAHYTDPNALTAAWTIPPSETQQLVPAVLNSALWTNPAIRPKGTWKKGPKKAKVAQSAWCEVCKILCNAQDVLDRHKLGKKHMKNLEKLQGGSGPGPAPVASAGSKNPVIGLSENPAKIGPGSEKKIEKKAATAEDLLAKRRKVLEGGAAVTSVRICAICNVVCNSDTVFRFHLAGQKHMAMMEKYASGK